MNLLVIVLISQAGTQLTRLLIKNGVAAIRASSLLALLFVFITLPFNFKENLSFHSAFLGATFVGMSDSGKMSEGRLFFAALIYSLLFYFVLPFNIGLGGALGLAAFSSCLFVQFMRENFLKTVKAKRS